MTGCGSGEGSGRAEKTVDVALHQQQAKRHRLERKLADVRRRARREARTARAARAKAEAARRSAGAGGPLFSSDAQRSFAALATSIPAEVGLAVAALGGSGEVETFGSLQSGHAWSTIKLPILVTLMREGALSAGEEQWAAAAIEASDNEAAASLFDQLERTHGGLDGASAAVDEVLAAAGSTGTTLATDPPPRGAVSTYGQTEWSLVGSATFLRSLVNGCLLDPAGTEYVAGLMGSVIPEQHWGLGEAGFEPSWSVGLKGGWGPEAGSGAYLVRQVGVVRDGKSGVVASMIASDPSGSFGGGIEAVTRLASWLRESLKGLGPAASDC